MPTYLKVIGLLCLLLAQGCSSTPEQITRIQVDQDYVNQVEKAAKNSAVNPKVYWVNPPKKREQELK
jgi:starvation-inducible outer membrane lipoprotein